MTIPLTPELLQATYDMLRVTPPFKAWNMPDGEDVVFKVSKDSRICGRYQHRDGRHVIWISAGSIGHVGSLIATMAHEMIHLHEEAACMVRSSEHSVVFQKLAARVCRFHGFDPKLF